MRDQSSLRHISAEVWDAENKKHIKPIDIVGNKCYDYTIEVEKKEVDAMSIRKVSYAYMCCCRMQFSRAYNMARCFDMH